MSLIKRDLFHFVQPEYFSEKVSYTDKLNE